MGPQRMARFFGLLLLAAPLAACFDGTIEVALTGKETARVEATQVINADTYAMLKRGTDEEFSALEQFCTVGTLTENADGGATCTRAEEGDFASLRDFSGEANSLTFTPESDGSIRVALSTEGIRKMAGEDAVLDEETRQMAEAFFAGHTITLRIAGDITETNLTLAKDERSAQAVYPILDLVLGKSEIPEEFYAVVRLP